MPFLQERRTTKIELTTTKEEMEQAVEERVKEKSTGRDTKREIKETSSSLKLRTTTDKHLSYLNRRGLTQRQRK